MRIIEKTTFWSVLYRGGLTAICGRYDHCINKAEVSQGQRVLDSTLVGGLTAREQRVLMLCSRLVV